MVVVWGTDWPSLGSSWMYLFCTCPDAPCRDMNLRMGWDWPLLCQPEIKEACISRVGAVLLNRKYNLTLIYHGWQFLFLYDGFTGRWRECGVSSCQESSQRDGGWRQKMQAVDGAIGLCEMIRGACSTKLSNSWRGGKGAEESMNFLNSLNPKRPRGQEVIPRALNHVTWIGTAGTGQFPPQAALSSETGTSNHQSRLLPSG